MNEEDAKDLAKAVWLMASGEKDNALIHLGLIEDREAAQRVIEGLLVEMTWGNKRGT